MICFGSGLIVLLIAITLYAQNLVVEAGTSCRYTRCHAHCDPGDCRGGEIFSNNTKSCSKGGEKCQCCIGGSSPGPRPAISPSVDTDVWYKSQSEKGDGAIRPTTNNADKVRWSSVKKQTMIHRYFKPTSFKSGDTVTFTMNWESDGYDGSDKDFQCHEQSQLLRCMAGTGDFRIGFYQSTGKVGSGICEGKKGASVSCSNPDDISDVMDDYRGFQVRVFPHLSEEFSKLGKWEVSGGNSNIALWTRKAKPSNGAHGLMSDSCHRSEVSPECGHSRDAPHHSSGEGGCDDKYCQWGPNMPFGEKRGAKFKLSRNGHSFTIIVTMNGKSATLHGEFDEHFAPDALDTFAIVYTNQSRKYAYVEITDWVVHGGRTKEEEEEEHNIVV